MVYVQKNDIINYLNKKFNFSYREFTKVNWVLKGILAGKNENTFNEKFAELEFSYVDNNLNYDFYKNIKHTKITLLKNDIQKVMNELNRIKDNLNKISEIK